MIFLQKELVLSRGGQATKFLSLGEKKSLKTGFLATIGCLLLVESVRGVSQERAPQEREESPENLVLASLPSSSKELSPSASSGDKRALEYLTDTYIQPHGGKVKMEMEPLARKSIAKESGKEVHKFPHQGVPKSQLLSHPTITPAKEVPHPTYRLVFGNPQEARVVLILWTSLTCPLCSKLYQGVVVRLKKIARENPAFALILRDYPTDPIALVGSSMVWARGDTYAATLLESLHREYDWLNPPEKALDALELLVLRTAKSEKERSLITQAKGDKASHQRVFDGRIQDKEILGLTQVPWAMVLQRKFSESRTSPSVGKSKDSWSVRTLGIPHEAVVDHMEKLLKDK